MLIVIYKRVNCTFIDCLESRYSSTNLQKFKFSKNATIYQKYNEIRSGANQNLNYNFKGFICYKFSFIVYSKFVRASL